MSKLGLSNRIFFQFLFIRLTKHMEKQKVDIISGKEKSQRPTYQDKSY